MTKRESEGAVLTRLRLEHQADTGGRLMRNNNGVAAFVDDTGRRRRVRYGLGVGTSDLIGWTPREITADMVGQTIAVFTAVELKRGSDTSTREQDLFARAVRNAGGIALVVEEP